MSEQIAEVKDRALKTLGMMLDYLGLDNELRAEEKNEALVISIKSANTGRIIGRKGQTLESLQLLLNRIIFRGNENGPHLILDVDGYTRGGAPREYIRHSEGGAPRRRRDRDGSGMSDDSGRKAVLEQQALDAAKEVKRWGESITLPKMNSHDRRIIHVTLQDDPEIETNSEGEGSMKKVVISLKKEEN